MGYLLAQLWPWLLLSGAIGVITGWWMWRSPVEADAPIAAPYIPPAPPEDEPLPDVPEASEPEPVETQSLAVANEGDAVTTEEPAAKSAPEEKPPAPSPFLAAPDGEPDDLTRIKGVGPKLNDVLHAMGVYHFHQIAGWSEADITEVDARLDTFQGRIERDRWVEQARYLHENDMVSFRREFGKPRGEV